MGEEETETAEITLEQAVANIPYATGSIQTVEWILYAVAALGCIWFCLESSKKFADGEYSQGKMNLIAAFITGASPHLAKFFYYY